MRRSPPRRQFALALTIAIGASPLAACASRVDRLPDPSWSVRQPPPVAIQIEEPADLQPQAAASRPDPLTEWSERLSRATGIPSRALFAYGSTELAMRARVPSCRLSWATLAGIGRVESDHGRFGGSSVGPDGKVTEPIIGVALTGERSVARIEDSDDGVLDGDESFDRAVGPMQFLPSTWMRYQADGNGDGSADPQQIDDAALAAGRYLCVGGRDLTTGDGWWTGVLSYNRSAAYGRQVLAWVNTYARLARDL